METHLFPHVFPLKFQYFEKFFEKTLFKIKFAVIFPLYFIRISLFKPLLRSVTMCDNPVLLPSNGKMSDIVKEHTVGKFDFKQCFLKKFLKILILYREYMKMFFNCNQHPWATKHPFTSLYFKYQSLK